MDCNEFRKISAGYLEDAVPSEQRQEVQQHLIHCPLCAALVRQMSVIREKIRLALCKDCCPGNLRQRVTRTLRSHDVKSFLRRLVNRSRNG